MDRQVYKQMIKQSFDTLRIGKVYSFTRTFTDADVSIFCGVTGDYNPYHIDDTFAMATSMRKRIIPGLLTASMGTHIGGMLGFLATSMNFEFLAPVFIGDTITCKATVAERDEEKRMLRVEVVCTNHEGKDVLTGSFTGFPSLIRLA